MNNKVAIIGAGPVGLYIAKELQQRGWELVVFEKNDKVGQKPCSSLISERIKTFIPEVVDIIQAKVKAVTVHFKKRDIKLGIRPPFLLFERSRLDHLLLGLAKQSGVKVLFNQAIAKIPSGFFRVIGTDGALSFIRRELGLPNPNLRLGIQYFVPNQEGASEVEVWPITFYNKPKYGFLWKIPRGDVVEYGGLGNSQEIKDALASFLEKKGIAFQSSKLKAALVPQGLILPNLENITLCGDAAGLTKPTTGGGLVWGLKAADLLIKNFPDFKKYRKVAKNFFHFKILKGKAEVIVGYFLGRHYPFILPKKITVDADLF